MPKDDGLKHRLEQKQCLGCGKTYLGMSNQKYCSRACYALYHDLHPKNGQSPETVYDYVLDMIAWQWRRKVTKNAERALCGY